MVINGKASAWLDVLSGVVQGSVLDSILYVIFIDNLDEVVRGLIKKFADVTKLAQVVEHFLVAAPLLYNSLCPSLGPWVGPWVRPSLFCIFFGGICLRS